MSNPFTPQANTNASTPFDDGEDDFAIEMPDTPVGVLRGHIAEVKKILNKETGKVKGYMVVVHCDDPAYPKAEDATLWVDVKETNKLRTLAAALGIACDMRGKHALFTDSEGNKGLAAFKHKPGFFVYAPYQGKVSLARFGLPRKGDSPEWDQYTEEAKFTDDQLAALKRSENGVVPCDKIDLFG